VRVVLTVSVDATTEPSAEPLAVLRHELAGGEGRAGGQLEVSPPDVHKQIVLGRLPGGAVHPGDLRCSPAMRAVEHFGVVAP